MSLDVRARSPDILESVQYFPGDETISPAAYRNTIMSGYITSVATIYGAARSLGLDIDTDTFERWKRIGAAAGLIDDFIDKSPDLPNAQSLFDMYLQDAPTLNESIPLHSCTHTSLLPALRLLQNSISTLPEGQVQKLISAARNIGRSALLKAQSTNINSYVTNLKFEAHNSSVLIYESVSEEVRDQHGYCRFACWCRHAIELGTLIDSSWDLWSDAKHGLTGIEATPLNAAKIAIRGIRSARALVHTSSNRRATIMGLSARLKFSRLPTALLVQR